MKNKLLFLFSIIILNTTHFISGESHSLKNDSNETIDFKIETHRPIYGADEWFNGVAPGQTRKFKKDGIARVYVFKSYQDRGYANQLAVLYYPEPCQRNTNFVFRGKNNLCAWHGIGRLAPSGKSCTFDTDYKC